jgi:hypothetical protein
MKAIFNIPPPKKKESGQNLYVNNSATLCNCIKHCWLAKLIKADIVIFYLPASGRFPHSRGVGDTLFFHRLPILSKYFMSSWNNLWKSFSGSYLHECAQLRVDTRCTLPFSSGEILRASFPASPDRNKDFNLHMPKKHSLVKGYFDPNKNETISVVSVHEWTVTAKQQSFVGEVSANFCG